MLHSLSLHAAGIKLPERAEVLRCAENHIPILTKIISGVFITKETIKSKEDTKENQDILMGSIMCFLVFCDYTVTVSHVYINMGIASNEIDSISFSHDNVRVKTAPILEKGTSVSRHLVMVGRKNFLFRCYKFQLNSNKILLVF